jgi:competence ComEA-like helix-hairpin-helix protein
MIDRINNKIKAIFGVTQSELIFVALLAAGLTIGAGYQYFASDEGDGKSEYADVYYLMDSLARTHKTAYTGSDMEGNRIEELSTGDTAIEKKTFFPVKKEAEKPGIININTASKVELMDLPGVGEKTSIKIINYRKNKPFEKPEDIRKIKGIGPKKFAKMKDMITTGNK